MSERERLRPIILALADPSKTRTQIANEVWAALSSDTREEIGLTVVKRAVHAALNNPLQYEFLLQSEPFPLEDVPIEDLKRRGRRLIAAGRKSIERGEAYLAEAKRREEAARHKA